MAKAALVKTAVTAVRVQMVAQAAAEEVMVTMAALERLLAAAAAAAVKTAAAVAVHLVAYASLIRRRKNDRTSFKINPLCFRCRYLSLLAA
jgi:hypothetical protein